MNEPYSILDLRDTLKDKYIIFGSEDSLDTDALVILDEPITTVQGCRELASTYVPIDVNFATVSNGELTWVYKGTVDEVNNSVFNTYSLHNQKEPCPITHLVKRDKYTKIKRCVRGLLSICSRTEHRTLIKQSLKSGSLYEQLKILELIDFKNIIENSEDKENSFPKKGSNSDVFKFIAFQLGQTIALILRDIEIYTKKEVVEHFKDLQPFIYKENVFDVKTLDKYKNILIYLI